MSSYLSLAVYTHDESLNRLNSGETLDFLTGSDHGCGFNLNLQGLPTPFLSEETEARNFETSLLSLCLSCDIISSSLGLWASLCLEVTVDIRSHS